MRQTTTTKTARKLSDATPKRPSTLSRSKKQKKKIQIPQKTMVEKAVTLKHADIQDTTQEDFIIIEDTPPTQCPDPLQNILQDLLRETPQTEPPQDETPLLNPERPQDRYKMMKLPLGGERYVTATTFNENIMIHIRQFTVYRRYR
jgi:hypothetical protein